MFKIVPKADCEAPVLKHSENVFHEALQGQGKYYHVIAEDGLAYDISYCKNNDMLPDNYRKTKKGIDVYPSYLTYDEKDLAQLDLSLLREHAAIVFQELSIPWCWRVWPCGILLRKCILQMPGQAAFWAGMSVFTLGRRYPNCRLRKFCRS